MRRHGPVIAHRTDSEEKDFPTTASATPTAVSSSPLLFVADGVVTHSLHIAINK